MSKETNYVLTGEIEQVRPHGDRRLPAESIDGSINGSQLRTCSLNNAASILIFDEITI